MMDNVLQCNECGHTAPNDDFTGLSEDEVSQIMEEDGDNIGSADDYHDLIGATACPECRSLDFYELF